MAGARATCVLDMGVADLTCNLKSTTTRGRSSCTYIHTAVLQLTTRRYLRQTTHNKIGPMCTLIPRLSTQKRRNKAPILYTYSDLDHCPHCAPAELRIITSNRRRSEVHTHARRAYIYIYLQHAHPFVFLSAHDVGMEHFLLTLRKKSA